MTERTPTHWLNASVARVNEWESCKPRRRTTTYLVCYTVVFIVLIGLFLLAYLPFGKSLIWSADGLRQYLPYFIYEGEWIRSLIGSLVSGQGWNPELWSWSMGYGSDVLSTLDAFWNPLNLLSVLVPPEGAEYMFQFMVVLRLWLAGAAFSWYSLYRGNGRFSTLCGALVYGLCGTALFVTVWPAGTDGLILFPLLLIGAEKLLEGKRPTQFIVAVALFFIVSYYFAYSAVILLIPYCIVRLILITKHAGKSITPKLFCTTVGKFLLFGVIGVLVACVALVPSLAALLGGDRATTTLVQAPLFYTPAFYQIAFAGFQNTVSVGSDCVIGFGIVTLICCITLFLQKKRELPLKITFVVLSACLALPFVGSLFNGFNYATNRWCWAYVLCVAYVVVRTVPLQKSLTSRNIKTIAVVSMLYLITVLILPQARSMSAIVSAFILIVALLLLAKTRKTLPSTQNRVFLIVLCACLITNAWIFAAPGRSEGWSMRSVPQGLGYAQLTQNTPNRVLDQVEDETWWRYDANPAPIHANNGTWDRIENDSVVLGLKGIDYYYSIYNGAIDAYHTELAIAGDNVNFRYYDLGGRGMLESLNSVKYYVNPADEADFRAYGYANPLNVVASDVINGSEVFVYEADKYLPLGYTYSSVIPRSTYLSLTPLQRQEALMQGVVLDDTYVEQSGAALSNSVFSETSVPIQMEGSTDIRFEDDGSITALKDGATLTVNVEGKQNCETYASVTGLTFTPQSAYALSTADERDSLSLMQSIELYGTEFNFKPDISYSIYAQADNGSINRRVLNSIPTYHMYGGKTDWALNLGYSEEAQSSITFTFSTAGRYTFTDFQVVCQPMDAVGDQIDALGKNTLQDLEVSNNALSGNINLDSKKYLYLSIPYSTGWSATVDGQPASIEKANTAFMALALEPGSHTVELHYMTPFLCEGGMLTILGISAFAVVALIYRKRDKKHLHSGQNHPKE